MYKKIAWKYLLMQSTYRAKKCDVSEKYLSNLLRNVDMVGPHQRQLLISERKLCNIFICEILQ